MPSPFQDISYFRAGLESLERYLLSDELFWSLDGDLPKLTIGGMLLDGKRLSVVSNQHEWTILSDRLDFLRSKWRSAWERKAGHEIHARLNLWKNYLQELREKFDPDNYSQQVQWRVMLQLLGCESPALAEELKTLPVLDSILKSHWLPGGFIWDVKLSIAFPEGQYWYLYGSLKSGFEELP